MLEHLFTNVFGRPKSKNNLNNRPATTHQSGTSQLTGPFSVSAPQMPQAPNLPYPPPVASSMPYPPNPHNAASYYPALPFSQPASSQSDSSQWQQSAYPVGTLAKTFSPLDSVPFEAKLTLDSSTNLVSLDQLFQEIKKAADIVDRADAYLRSSQSDYDFKIEQGLIYH